MVAKAVFCLEALTLNQSKLSSRPRIGITLGDPAGIGPEIVRKAASCQAITQVCRPVLYGSESITDEFVGRESAESGMSSYTAVENAVRDALDGVIDGIATAPISKSAWALAGLPWRGHTECLGALTGVDHVRMLFYSSRLTVVLSTVHMAIADVSRMLTKECLKVTIELTHKELPHFGVDHPRLVVSGLNPHAGEDGLMGDEERRVITPVVRECRRLGIDVSGPISGDTVFLRAAEGEFDAVIACYHDQGLIPVKLLSFGKAVNVTLGLPIVRTSVDHGTAFDIAGKDQADPSSMIAAVRLAAQLATARAAALRVD